MREPDFPFFRDDEDPAATDRAGATLTADREESATRAKVAPAKRRTRRALLITLAALLVPVLLIAGLLGFYFHRVDSTLGNLHQESLLPEPYAGQPVNTSQAMNVLIVGADKNDNGSDGRSDVLMVAHLSADRKDLYLVSFPRDLWVEIAENQYVSHRSKAKINAAYSWGRAPLAVRTVEELTNTKIDHTAEINFGGFVELTQTLGGVTVYNKHASQSRGYTFPQGEITVAGEQALVFVRQRYGLPNGDLDRAERQRAVLSSIISKAVAPETLANPAKFSEMLDLLSRQVVVDQTLPSSEVKNLVYGLKLREGGSIHSLQAPITGFGTSSDGQSIALADEAQLAELSAALRDDRMAEYVAKYPG